MSTAPTRRRRPRRQATARFATTCDRCELVIRPGDAYAIRHGSAIHATCAPGGDDR